MVAMSVAAATLRKMNGAESNNPHRSTRPVTTSGQPWPGRPSASPFPQMSDPSSPCPATGPNPGQDSGWAVVPTPNPLPPLGTSLAASRARRWDIAGLTELVLALPWLWWSWLAVQFVGIPSDTIANVALGVWLVSGAGLLYTRTQELLAWKVWRLRPPSELESRRIGPAWWAVCAAAGVNPDRFRVG